MTHEKLTFWLFIQQQSGSSIEKFKNMFGSNIEHLPNYVTSARKIRRALNVDTLEKDIMFRKVWLEYFKTKLMNLR